MLHNKPLGLYGAFKSESQDAPWRFGEREWEEVEVIGNGKGGGAHEMDKGWGRATTSRRSAMQLAAWRLTINVCIAISYQGAVGEDEGGV